jgi:hypothetical protein
MIANQVHATITDLALTKLEDLSVVVHQASLETDAKEILTNVSQTHVQMLVLWIAFKW